MKIIFCGASSEIGASCIFVNIDGKNILMDSGIRMTDDPLPEFRAIQENGGIDCILVSHSQRIIPEVYQQSAVNIHLFPCI